MTEQAEQELHNYIAGELDVIPLQSNLRDIERIACKGDVDFIRKIYETLNGWTDRDIVASRIKKYLDERNL